MARLIASRSTSLVDDWAERVRLLRARDGRATVLHDAMHGFLRDLTAALEGAPVEPGPPSLRSGLAIDEVIEEYALLQNVLLDAAGVEEVVLSTQDTRVMLAFFSDAVAAGVSEYRRAVDRAEHAEVRRQVDTELRIATNALPVLVALVDADERYRIVNKAYEEWFGVWSEDISGKTIRAVIGEAAYTQLQPLLARGLAGESVDLEDHGISCPDGVVRDIRVSFRPYADRAGHRSGYFVLIEDITAQRAQAREREALALHGRDVLEVIGDCYIAIDRDWTIVLVNEKYEQMCGRSREALVGRNVWALFPAVNEPGNAYFNKYHECMERAVPVTFQEYYRPLDRWTDAHVYPTKGGGIAIFLRDISQEKRAEAALKARAEFEQLLLGIASHDLRSPLTVIAMDSSTLESAAGLTPSEVQAARRVRRAAGRASELARDLLDFTQARLGGGIPIEPRPVDLHAVVEPIIEEVATVHAAREIVYEREESDATDAGVWDPERLGQVVQNLVSNAIEHSPPGSPVIVRSRAEEDAVMLDVHNGGDPIPAPRLGVIFEPFERGVTAGNNPSRSVGLGLYIVREVVAAHGGKVSVASNARDGTTFTVTLPRRTRAVARE